MSGATQREPIRSCVPVMRERLPVESSKDARLYAREPVLSGRMSEKVSKLPSGDQSTAPEFASTTVCGDPPSVLITYTAPVEVEYATCFPSGEMTGAKICVGGKVSWRGSVPSLR